MATVFMTNSVAVVFILAITTRKKEIVQMESIVALIVIEFIVKVKC